MFCSVGLCKWPRSFAVDFPMLDEAMKNLKRLSGCQFLAKMQDNINANIRNPKRVRYSAVI